MQNKIKRFLACSLVFICIICICVFTTLALYLNKQNEQTITQLGNIYMSSMNDRICKHFGSITDHRLTQMQAFVESVPDQYGQDKEALKEWLTHNGEDRGYVSLSFCRQDGSFEPIYGQPVEFPGFSAVYSMMDNGKGRVAIGINSDNAPVVLICVPIQLTVPGTEDFVILAGELPIRYLEENLSLEENDSLIYSFVIRDNGSFVVRSAGEVRENYFDRVRAIYEEIDGRSNEEYLAELKAAMAAEKDYSTMIQIGGDRLHLYCSSLPNSFWYLVTLMPYGALNESVESLGARSFGAAALACVVVLLILMATFVRYFRMNRLLLRELREAKQTAETASRSKSEFLSNMSHDIRTPMNAVMGMTAIAMAHLDDQQQVGNCLKKIALSSKHLLGLINDVLDMSKIESGKMTLNVELVSLREIMDSIVNIVQPQVKAKNQEFNISIYNITSENIQCDSVRLSQVLLNLLSNAVKFTPEGGSIWVILHEEPSPKGEEYVRIRLYVKDNGIGMSQEFQKYIFDSFAREDSRRVHRTEGTGLGMAITKYIVDAMGGEIIVESQQGVGTEFRVTLDMERAQEQVEDMILPDWPMLVVDDDCQLCESVTDSLKSIGIQAEWVLDGEGAIRMAVQRHKSHSDYYIILLDWKMPDMDGIETARELRRQLGDDVPILLMSAYDWSDIEEEARAAGISGFLMKPLFRSTLYYGLRPFAKGVETPAPQEDRDAKFANKRVLVAEDNELNWEIAQELLQDLGLELEWAENGKICVDKFRQSPPGYYDAVLMDIRMPVMDGYEAVDQIRAMERPDASLPVIAMTADAYSDDIQRCLDHGMNAHVAKPIDIKEVARILKKYLEA